MKYFKLISKLDTSVFAFISRIHSWFLSESVIKIHFDSYLLLHVGLRETKELWSVGFNKDTNPVMYSKACVLNSMLWNVCVLWCVYASCLLVQCQTCPSVASFSVQQASPKPQLWRTSHLAACSAPSIFPSLCSRLLLFIYSPSFVPLDPFLLPHVLPWV